MLASSSGAPEDSVPIIRSVSVFNVSVFSRFRKDNICFRLSDSRVSPISFTDLRFSNNFFFCSDVRVPYLAKKGMGLAFKLLFLLSLWFL